MLILQYNRLVARLEAKTARLAILETTLTRMSAQEIGSFEFNSGEASQKVSYRNSEGIEKAILRLEREIDQLYRTLYGRGHIRFIADRRG
jgi:hypothetical protein